MSENELKKGSPSRKLGVKYLDDNQLTNSFPDWQALLTRIEEQRQIAEFASKGSYQPEEGRFPQAYDNLFAVLGGRGSGKSSVILTLREKMKQSSSQDILLPIITPEVISEPECSILGWIMSATELVVTSLERRLETLSPGRTAYGCEFSRTLDPFFKDCRFKKDNPLRRSYQDLFEKSVSTSGMLDTTAYSAEDAVVYRVMQSRRQYKLIQDLNNFWNLLSEVWYEAWRHDPSDRKHDQKVERPLIILMFDDIDLVPERSMELLTTTFQYFTNPNIIIILTASEKTLKEVIRLKMVDRMVGSKSGSLLIDVSPWGHNEAKATHGILNQFEPDSATEMAQEFYDKVIPPSSRYKLRRYESISEKFLYAYSSAEQAFWVPKLGECSSIPLQDFLIDQVDQLVQFFPRKNKGTKTMDVASNFLMGGKEQKTFQKAYFLIFGVKSRNIANGCLEIMNTFDRLKKLRKKDREDIQGLAEWELTQEEHREVLLAMRHLVQALLLSKKDLAEYADDVQRFLYTAPDRIGNYVDYDFASHCYNRELQDIRDWFVSQPQEDTAFNSKQRIRLASQHLGKVKRKIAALMMVMFFAEGILVITDCGRHHIHGHRQLNRLLNADVIIESKGWEFRTKGLALFPKHQKTRDFLYQSPLVLEHIDRYVGVNQYDYQYAWDYLEDIFRAQMDSGKAEPITILRHTMDKDLEWVKMVLTMLAVRYSGITYVEPQFIQALGVARKTLNLFAFSARFTQQTEQAAKDFMMGRAQHTGLANNDRPDGCDLMNISSSQMQQFLDMIQETHQWEKTLNPSWEPFFQADQGIITLQARDDQYNNLISSNDPDQSYIKTYLYYRWREFAHAGDGAEDIEGSYNTYVNQCYSLVRFVEDTLSKCVNRIINQTDIYLESGWIGEILTRIRHIENYNLKFKRKKDACIAQLERATLRQPSLRIVTEAVNSDRENREEGPKQKQLWRISAAPLIECLSDLGSMVLDQTSEMSYYDNQNDIDTYFYLVSNLAVSYRHTSEDMPIGGKKIPESSELISELKMLEFLLPYYFSAHMGIAVDNRFRSELPPGRYGRTDEMDQRLQKLFHHLVTIEHGRTGYAEQQLDERLRKLMETVQRELAEDYYSSLEVHDE